jgi:short-subunit dehydrogenase
MPQGVVLITGASQGIGLATAAHLGRAGYKVYATCRDPSKAYALQQLSKELSTITILALDVLSKESIHKAVASVMQRESVLDAVINNAGFGIYGPSETHTIEEIRQIFEANFFGVIRVNQAVVPIMRKQLHGRIINIGSISGAVPSKNLSVYSASKAALESLSASDAYHYSKWGIKVSLIQAGAVVTNFERSTPYGGHFNGAENPYADILPPNRETWATMMKNGQPASEVAKVIQEAIESPNPRLWYQTSQVVKDSIGNHFKDLTGNRRIPAKL